MARYQLECSCGEIVLVEPRQAGDLVRCRCGADLEVPPLRQIRALPAAEDATTADAGPGKWSARQGVLTVGLLAVVAFAGAAVYFRVTEPRPPEKLDEQQRDQIVAQNIELWTPGQAWRMWVAEYRPKTSRGTLDVVKNPYEGAINRRIEMHRIGQYTCYALAAVCGVAALVAFLSIRPR